MDIVGEIREQLNAEWLPDIYRSKVRTQRTRAHSLEVASRENRAIIQHTLLGVELKVGNQRFPVKAEKYKKPSGVFRPRATLKRRQSAL